MIVLTHVCQTWREVFISRTSLWTDLDYVCTDKTLVYLERSKSSPITVSLRRDEVNGLLPIDPFFQITPSIIGRLKSLSIQAVPWNMEGLIDQLSHPAPILEDMGIDGESEDALEDNPVLEPTLFNGDLSSLRELRLKSVDTDLPWRNMANLATFTFVGTESVSLRQLLDFLENTSRLHEVKFHRVTLGSGLQEGRLISLPCLKRLVITVTNPSSILLEHLSIPAGAFLEAWVELPNPPVDGLPPRFLNNFKNLPNFTTIRLRCDGPTSCFRFTGPNREVQINNSPFRRDNTHFSLKSLAQFDTAKAERLSVEFCNFPPLDLPYWVFLPMKNLRTLSLDRCRSLRFFIHALDPTMNPSGVVVCPKLEEIVIFERGLFNFEHAMGMMAASRALRGAKLKAVRIIDSRPDRERDPAGTLELRKHVCHVEFGPVRSAKSDGEEG